MLRLWKCLLGQIGGATLRHHHGNERPEERESGVGEGMGRVEKADVGKAVEALSFFFSSLY